VLVGLKIIIVNEKQVCVQPLQSADYVALPAFAAARLAAAPLLLTAGPPAVQQSIDVTWLSGPQQQTRTSGVRRRMEQTGRRRDDQTHGRPTVAQTLLSSVNKLSPRGRRDDMPSANSPRIQKSRRIYVCVDGSALRSPHISGGRRWLSCRQPACL